MAGQYPRVLIVHLTKVKADDPVNLLVRTEFARWPKERLAQIHSGETAGHGEFCGHYYRLQPRDRLFGRLFFRLREPVFNAALAMEDVSELGPAAREQRFRRHVAALKARVANWIIASGLWEVVFRAHLSPAMAAFIRGFDPEVIYCSGYSLGFATLPFSIGRHFRRPLCFQTLEDWPAFLYRYSPVGALVRRRARRLIRGSGVRLAFGEKMRDVFERRYGVPFHVTYHLDDRSRFADLEVPRPEKPRRVVFTGNLVLNRGEAIADLLKAVRLAGERGVPIEIDVYCAGVPKGLAAECRLAPEIRFLPLPPHDELPAVLRGADVLFLPEAFSVGANRLGLAISTKCHLFMMAERAILVYGPGYAGTVEYARQEGWGLVVDRRDVSVLAAALVRLLGDETMRVELVRRATECFKRNHELKKGQERFEGLVRKLALRGWAASGAGGLSAEPDGHGSS